ncbi:unnamed protein product [Victoria cruziana]
MLEMTTESPVRLVGNGGARTWSSSKETASVTSPSDNVAAEELGMLLRGHTLHRSGQDGVPNRSESAPPSIEGSFAVFGELFGQQNPNSILGRSGESLSTTNYPDSDGQYYNDAAYASYYYSNIKLNPRLPPPIVSSDTRRLVGRLGDGRKFSTSLDDSSNKSLFFSRSVLSTHKEEPEDDRSPVGSVIKHAYPDPGERSRTLLSGRSPNSSGRHKSLVDLIQEDFPRTPSPVYNQPRLTNTSFEESPNSDSLSLLHEPSSKVPEGGYTTAAFLGVNVMESTSDANALHSVPHPTTSSLDKRILISGSGDVDLSCPNSSAEDASLLNHVTNSEIDEAQASLKGLNITNLQNASDFKRQDQQRDSQMRKLSPQHPQHGLLSHGRSIQSHGLVQVESCGHVGMGQPSHGNYKVPPALVQAVEVQPVLQPSGMTPQLYAAGTAYMASGSPLYHNLQAANVYASQYNMGGYTMNAAVVPPMVAGYGPQNIIPMTYDASATANFHARAAGSPLAPNLAIGLDVQQLYKYNGQVGLALQPSYGDPLFYLPLPADDTYGAQPQYNPVAHRFPAGNQIESFDTQKISPLGAYNTDQKSQFLHLGAINTPDLRKGAFASTSYYGNPPGMGLLLPFPTSSLGSPSYTGMPVARANFISRQSDDTRLPVGSNRNIGASSGWQGSRGNDKNTKPKSSSFLEELKSSKIRRFGLSDIVGRTVEFSTDQHGSRFIQQKLENCSPEEKASVFEEVLPHASALMTDVFGNYVIQKFFEHGNAEQRKNLADQLIGHVLQLSLQMYGCRVIQKALEVIELDQKTLLVMELDGHVLQCVRDQNGNHVIQKCIECLPSEKIEFIISAFHGQVFTLSKHPYGCRVIQRILEHCTDGKQSQCIVDEILESVHVLAQDQYGNYVTQHVLERGKPHERSQIINKLAGQIVQLSQHKFASNVIEKCLEHGGLTEREHLIDEILGQTEANDNLLTMMKDQFANYVVQKILERSTDQQREVLLNRIRVHLHALRKYTYGKHIVARVEQLIQSEVLSQGSSTYKIDGLFLKIMTFQA